MALPERVVHLVEDRGQYAVVPVTEIDAERIEGVSEDARYGEQQDRPIRFDARLIQMTDDPVAWRFCPLAVVAIMEAEKVEAIVGE